MGVYIKGMEMPENCDSCFCYYNPPDSWEKLCSVSQREWYMSDKKPDWCPLFPVPNHKGPLVDVLEVLDTFPEEYIFTNAQERALTNYIIPADKEDTNV